MISYIPSLLRHCLYLLIHIAHQKDCPSFFNFYFPLTFQGFAHIDVKEFGVILSTIFQGQVQIYYLGTDNAAVINQLS